jgi:UDP-N-acetylglucosamine 4-epimerase
MNAYDKARERLRAGSQPWLVTGAAGFIGSSLVEALLRLDQRVTGLDNFSTGKPENLEHLRASVGEAAWQRFSFIQGDIRSLEDCRRACAGQRYVLHQAALGSVVRSVADPLTSHASNVTGFLNMLLAARDAGVGRFVYASSSAAYGDHPALPKVEAQIGRALSPYGLTKHINELYAAVFATCYGFSGIGLRYFNVFGPRQDADGTYASVIPKWIGALLRGQPAWINGDGSTTRDFCHIDNVVQANLLSATVEDARALGQAYNVAAGDQTSLSELFGIVRGLLAQRRPELADAQPQHREFRAGDVQHSRADMSKAAELLGYQPAVRVLDGLQRTVDWYVADALARNPAAGATTAAMPQPAHALPTTA